MMRPCCWPGVARDRVEGTEMDHEGEGHTPGSGGELLGGEDLEMRAAAHEALQAALEGCGGDAPQLGAGIARAYLGEETGSGAEAPRAEAAIAAQNLMKTSHKPQSSPGKKAKPEKPGVPEAALVPWGPHCRPTHRGRSSPSLGSPASGWTC